MSEWLELARRCEQATGADDHKTIAETTKAIMRALGYELRHGAFFRRNNGGEWFCDGSRIMVSLDAITTLIERELPGALYGSDVFDGRAGAVIDGQTRGDMGEHIGSAATEALARCAAFCRAMAERGE
jgi:hypothetical protein